MIWKKYILFKISDDRRKKTDLFPTSSSRTIDPCLTLIDNEKYFGVVKDEYLITIPSSDEVKNKMKPDSGTSILDPKTNKSFPTIAWSEPPQMLVWDEPYLLGLVTDAT